MTDAKFGAEQTLNPKQKEALDAFRLRHPEIENIRCHYVGSSVEAASSLPAGVVAIQADGTRLQSDILPEKRYGVCALYQLAGELSEIQLLGQPARLQEATRAFLAATSLGPALHDIGLPTSDHLPHSYGKDLKAWAPFLGKDGYVSVLTDRSSESDRTYYLMVSVPELPFANEAMEPLTLLPTTELTTHTNVRVLEDVAQRNANKIAGLAGAKFGLQFRHRRPDMNSPDGQLLPVPIACTLNTLLRRPSCENLNIASGLGYAQRGGEKSATVFPLSPKAGALLAPRISHKPLPLQPPTSDIPMTVQDVGKSFVADRVYWSKKSADALPRVLAQRVVVDPRLQEMFVDKYRAATLSPVLIVTE
jgi:hypothetical protein